MRQDRLLEIVGRIYQRPETWNQTEWHRGTAHCVAGHAQNALRGIVFTDPCDYASYDGAKWLDLSRKEADWLFDIDRTLDELIRAAVTGDIP